MFEHSLTSPKLITERAGTYRSELYTWGQARNGGAADSIHPGSRSTTDLRMIYHILGEYCAILILSGCLLKGRPADGGATSEGWRILREMLKVYTVVYALILVLKVVFHHFMKAKSFGLPRRRGDDRHIFQTHCTF